jgi:hypothetical protein
MRDQAVALATAVPEAGPTAEAGLTLVSDAAADVLGYEDEAAWEEHGREFTRESEKTHWKILWNYGDWIVAAEKCFDGARIATRRPLRSRASGMGGSGTSRARRERSRCHGAVTT